MKKFNKYFMKSHFMQNWLVYVLLVLAIVYLFITVNQSDLSSFFRVLENISLSYIAAYIFYLFVNLIPSYFQQKNALLTVEKELNHIVIDIFSILSILQTFSKDNYEDFFIPNAIVYLEDSNSKTFFNPRDELEDYTKRLNQELASIKTKYCLLPVDIIVTLNTIEQTELQQKLKSLYQSIDKKYTAKIYEFPECLYILENASYDILKYFNKSQKIEKYKIMNEEEVIQYKQEQQEVIPYIKAIEHRGRIYKGSMRIK